MLSVHQSNFSMATVESIYKRISTVVGSRHRSNQLTIDMDI